MRILSFLIVQLFFFLNWELSWNNFFTYSFCLLFLLHWSKNIASNKAKCLYAWLCPTFLWGSVHSFFLSFSQIWYQLTYFQIHFLSSASWNLPLSLSSEILFYLFIFLVIQAKCLLEWKRVCVNRLTWVDSAGSHFHGTLNHLYGAVLPIIFLWFSSSENLNLVTVLFNL